MVQVGNLMVVGGSFTKVTPNAGPGAGTTVTRNHLFAFNASTGALSTSFVPTVNGEVDAIVANADSTGVYVGGLFTSAGGVATRLAEFNLSNGSRVGTFNPSLNGPINAMALVGSRLFLGGNFTTVKGTTHQGLVSVNSASGALDPYLTVNLTGNHNYGRVAGSAQARVGATDIAVSPDGSRMIVDGNFINAADTVNPSGYARDQIANIILGSTQATVDPNWNTSAYTHACYSWAYDSYVRHISWSPDGSYFVVAATGGYFANSFQDCDAASRFEASATGLNVKPTWTDYTGTDSLYSVAVTSDAVYVGGHNRWLNNPYGQDSPKNGAVPRPGLAALDPVTGVPLSWNPGRNPRGHGAEEIYATSAGIWVGSDTDYIGNYQYRHQKLAFFPFAGGTPGTTDNTGDPRTVFVGGASGNSFTANTFDPTTGAGSVSSSQPSNGGGIAWGSVQGAFVLNGRIWYGQGGQFYYRTWDGANNFGAAQLVDPYNDPYWDGVVTGSSPSGSTYRGAVTSFYAEFPNVTGMFYANRSIYYTLSGSKNLYSRAFSPDTRSSSVANQVTGGVISGVETTVVSGGNPVNFSSARGMFVASGYLWYATSDGLLHKAPWNGTTVTGAGSLDTSATGNWAGKAVFVSPVAPPVQPTASFTVSCPNATCYFDASASTAPGSTIASYAWDFGDGSPAGSGVKPTHAYSATGTYHVTLTVTNAQSATNSVTHDAVVTTLNSSGIGFVAQANTNGNGTSETVTVPSAVVAGDGLILIATGTTTGSLTAPAGWTLLGSKTGGSALTTTAWEKVATGADANSPVTIGFPAVVHGTVQLLAYSGTNAAAPVAASASSAIQQGGTSYTTPTSNVPANGDVVLSYWAAKNSSVTAWTTPAGQTIRSVADGSGGGRINSVATDGGPATTGPTGGLAASVNGSAGAFAAWTIVLDASGGTPPPPANPTADFTATCTMLACHFDASSSTPGGAAITDYTWNFGDGSPVDDAGSATTADHTFGSANTYNVKLTVTDANHNTGSKTTPVSVTDTAAAVAFVGQANTNGNATTETVTVPSNVTPGDALVLIATGATGSPLSAPAGWTALGTSSGNTAVTTAAWQKVAQSGDPGSPVTVTFPAVVHGTVQLLAYAGATTPAVASVSSALQRTGTSYTTPTSTVTQAGDVVISYWAAKSSAVTGWTTPAGQTVQSVANGSGGGRINSVATDGGSASAGPTGGLTATTAGTAGAFAAWTIVLQGSGTAPPPPPTANFDVTCTMLACHFDATTSSAPGGTITSYAWNFGDGGSGGTGLTADHTFAAANTYNVTLTVTDSNSNTGSKTIPVTVSDTAPPPPTVAYVGAAATDGNGTSETVTVPSNVAEGDGLILIATGATGGPLTAPAGWILVDTASWNSALTTTIWQRVATATDHGTTVSVGFPAIVHGTVQLLAYSGTSTANPVVTAANRVTAGSATTYQTPVATVPSSGDVVLSVWTVKSSSVNSWAAPSGQNVRSTAYGSGGGRIDSLVSDGGAASAGSAGGLTATTDNAGSVFAAWTIVIG